MKLKINTDTKEIELEDKVNLKELFDLLNNLFPDFKWNEYSLNIISHNITWNPGIISNPPYIPYIGDGTDIGLFGQTGLTSGNTVYIDSNPK